MDKVIIFGATGFIGSHVLEAFAKAGHMPTAVVRPNSDVLLLQDLGVKIVRQQDFSLPALIDLLSVYDVVVNCIANVHPHQRLTQYNAVNVTLAERLARAAAQAGCKRLLQLSSVEVYGENAGNRLRESDACEPLFDFQHSLLMREQVLQAVAAESEMDIVLLRPAASFGPRSAFVNMLVKSVAEEEFPLLGEGVQISSAVDTRDIGRAVVFLADAKLKGLQIFNLAAYDFSMQLFKSGLEKQLNTRLKFRRLPLVLAKMLARVMVSVMPYGSVPMLTPFIVHASNSSLLIDDGKLRTLGFTPRYVFADTLHYLVDSYPQLSKMSQVEYV